jgi:hypothetical protein
MQDANDGKGRNSDDADPVQIWISQDFMDFPVGCFNVHLNFPGLFFVPQ